MAALLVPGKHVLSVVRRAAVVAHEGSVAGVSSLVVVSVAQRCKRHRAVTALEGLLTGMESQVVLQTGGANEDLLAVLAGKRLCVRSCADASGGHEQLSRSLGLVLPRFLAARSFGSRRIRHDALVYGTVGIRHLRTVLTVDIKVCKNIFECIFVDWRLWMSWDLPLHLEGF